MMQSMDVMGMTMTATGCVWSSPGAAGAQEAGSGGSAELREADMGLRPGAPSTGSLCRVGGLSCGSHAYIVNSYPLDCCLKYCVLNKTFSSEAFFWVCRGGITTSRAHF